MDVNVLDQRFDSDAVNEVIAGNDDHVSNEGIEVLPQAGYQLVGIPVKDWVTAWLASRYIELQLTQQFRLLLKDIFGVEKEDRKLSNHNLVLERVG